MKMDINNNYISKKGDKDWTLERIFKVLDKKLPLPLKSSNLLNPKIKIDDIYHILDKKLDLSDDYKRSK